MNRRSLLQIFGLACAAVLLSGCWNNSITRNFKIIATAVVDGQEVQGFTVMTITWTGAHTNRGNYVEAEGEALILDLKQHGTIYVLSGRIDDENRRCCGWMSIIGFVLKVKDNGNSAEFPKIYDAKGRYVFPNSNSIGSTPIIVAFHDETRKDSAFRILPAEFEKVFGSGVSFKSLEFEPTDEPVTHLILQRLPMLNIEDPNNSYAPPIIPGHLKGESDLTFLEKMRDSEFFIPSYGGKSFYSNRKYVK